MRTDDTLIRLLDIAGALAGLSLGIWFVVPASLLIWITDWHSPFFLAPRVGKDGRPFRMVKLRTMVWGAEGSGVDSTAADDPRILPVGRFIRSAQIDEIPQFWNVLKGDMSLVGPRPNVARETVLYTTEEERLLSLRPGITDFASIVFSDLSEILRGSPDANVAYNQLVRPWKSRLGLFYVENRHVVVNGMVLLLTTLALFHRPLALRGVSWLLERLDAPEDLARIALREEALTPTRPPGATEIVSARPN